MEYNKKTVSDSPEKKTAVETEEKDKRGARVDCARESDYLSDANTSTYAVPDRFAAPPTSLPLYRSQQDASPAAGLYGGGGPVVDDSGVYSALPGTPPPWVDYDDDRGGTSTDRAVVALPEFPRDRLRFVEKLGEGLFGEVRGRYSWC